MVERESNQAQTALPGIAIPDRHLIHTRGISEIGTPYLLQIASEIMPLLKTRNGQTTINIISLDHTFHS
jgi:hypothetical protein